MATETNVKKGWLKGANGDYFAPKTLVSQISDAKGTALANIMTDNIDTATNAAKQYTDDKFVSMVGNDNVETQISAHNTAENAHADIRKEVADLSKEVKDFTGLNDETVEKLEEVLELLDQNGEDLAGVLSGKVNTTDIADNLTTNDSAKVLSAAQGVAIKTAMDAMQEDINDKADAEDLDNYVLTNDLTNGNVTAEKANRLNVTKNVGASNQPVYFDSSGEPVAISYTIGVSVPSWAQFTDSYPPNASASEFGLVQSGGDVTISNGTITVNDNSHNHTISNVDGLQNALDGKQATITGAAYTITSSDLTANRALISNNNGKIAVSSTITSTELSYLNNVTSNIQDQFANIANGNTTVGKATQDGNGNNIVNTYATKTALTKVIDGTTTVGKATQATLATNADSATKATCDGSGNNIANTYATKAELAAGANHTHDDRYYTENEINTKVATINTSIDGVNAKITNITDGTTTVPKATTANKLGTTTLGGVSTPIYLESGQPKSCGAYAGGTAVTLNGAGKGGSSASFYAPISVGDPGDVLMSMGTGAPAWVSIDFSGNSSYTLPTASTTEKGGIKPGNGVYMNGEYLNLNLATNGGLTTSTNGQLKLSNPLPSVNTSNAGQFLRVNSSGVWAAVAIKTAESEAL